MDISVTLRHGPLDVEITADSDEDYKQELLDLAEFLEENEEHFDSLNTPAPSEETTTGDNTSKQAPLDSHWGEEQKAKQETVSVGLFESVSRRTGVDESTLARIFDVPEESEANDGELPAIFVDEFEEGSSVFGSSRRERQARASLVLLYLWDECLGVTEVESGSLSDALHMSGIDPENKYHMYNAMDGDADRYFSREKGGNSTVKLTRQGNRAAIDEIKSLVENV
jgi:hypothetical protein